MDRFTHLTDVDELPDGHLKTHCQYLLSRATDINHSLVSGYGMPAYLDNIRLRITAKPYIGASIRCDAGLAEIELSIKMIHSLRCLFERLFSDDALLPQIADDSEGRIRYSGQYLKDVIRSDDWVMYDFDLSKNHWMASNALSDLCITFVLLHEYGHLIAGHAGYQSEHSEGGYVSEFATITESREDNPNLRRYWEYQADNIAASFLTQYVERLIDVAPNHQTWILHLRKEPMSSKLAIATEVSALAIGVIHVLFLYMDYLSDKDDRKSYHPAAQGRMMYSKDILAEHMCLRITDLSPEIIVETYFEQYLENVMSAMNNIGIPTTHRFGDDYMQVGETDYQTLVHSHEQYRSVTAPWSWIDVNGWNIPRKI